MAKSIGLLLIGFALLTILFMSGCGGPGGSYSTTVYRDYNDPYPGWGYRPVYVDHRHDYPNSRPPGYRPPPGGRPPGMGRPPGGRPPVSNLLPRPTQLPARRAR